MTELVNQTNLAEYEAFVQSHPKGHFAQSSLWAKQKPAWTWQAIICRGEDGKIKGSVAFLIRKMPIVRKKMMYACRGPVCDLTDRATFEELMERAKTDAAAAALLKETDVLVDGPFLLALRSFSAPWRGSTNQRLIDVKKSLAAGAAVEMED